MKRFRIQLRGENFLLDLDGEHGKFGLRATRVIRANTSQEAERIGLIQIHQELNQSSHIIKSTPDAPRMIAETIDELKFYQFVSKKTLNGFEFFSEEQDEP